MEADKFEATRFSELYALSRKAAPRILHIITRMKLASPQIQETIASRNTENVSRYTESLLPYPEGPEADGQIHDALRHVAKLDTAQEETPAGAFTPLPYPEEENAPHPPIPGSRPRTFHMPKAGLDRKAQRLGTTVYPAASTSASDVHLGSNLSPAPGQISLSFLAVPPRSPARRSNTYHMNGHLEPPPEFAAAPATPCEKEGMPGTSPRSYTRASIGSSTVVSSQSSVSEHHHGGPTYVDIVSPVSATDRDSLLLERHGRSLQVPPLFAGSTTEFPILPVGGKLNVPGNTLQDVPDGLIPVDDETAEHAPPLRPPPPVPEDCSITLNSSFYHFKGFCQGSMEIIQGGLGVRRIKKQVSSLHLRKAVQSHLNSIPGPFWRFQRGRQVQIMSVRT